MYNTGGWLTENGNVNLARVQVIVDALGEVEDEIFKKRHSDEVRLSVRFTDIVKENTHFSCAFVSVASKKRDRSVSRQAIRRQKRLLVR